MTEGYETPERAAIGDIPEEYCRVIASETKGDHAYVLLDTGTAVSPYPYGVFCELEGDQWVEGGGSNGGGWSLTDEDAETGTLAYWDAAPPRANTVKLKFKRRRFEIPAQNDYFLLVLWDVPAAIDFSSVQVLAYRFGTNWKARSRLETWRERRDSRRLRRFIARVEKEIEWPDQPFGIREMEVRKPRWLRRN